MNKKYFLWLQEIANINEKFNVNIYFKIINKIGSLYNLYNNLDENLLINLKIDKSIIVCLKDNNIKEKINVLYSKVNGLNLNLFTLDEYYYFNSKIESFEFEIPFCIIIPQNIKLDSKNVYIYYSEYYSKFAINIIKYFSKIILNEGGNVISSINSKDILNIDICDFNDLKNSNSSILLPNIKYASWFIFCFIDVLILVEARYEKKIVSLVDNYLYFGKDIYVVPSNIFSKNSYFSNYLIKEGADVILNKNDLKFILRKNIR